MNKTKKMFVIGLVMAMMSVSFISIASADDVPGFARSGYVVDLAIIEEDPGPLCIVSLELSDGTHLEPLYLTHEQLEFLEWCVDNGIPIYIIYEEFMNGWFLVLLTPFGPVRSPGLLGDFEPVTKFN